MKAADRLPILYRYWLTRYGRKFKDRASLVHWQQSLVERHLAEVRRKSPFYDQLWEGRSLKDWRDFPIIDKAVMMEQFDRLNTAGIRKVEAFALALKSERTRDFAPTIGGVTIGLSSGTSGNRGLFVVSRSERRAWAGAVLAKVLPGSIAGQHRIAFFLRANSNLYGTVGSRRLQFAFYDLLDPFERHMERLAEQRPSLLVAPPSMLRLIAERQAEGALRLAPNKIVSVAEVLEPLDRRVIEAAFGQPVHQVYQCTEGFLGATCAYGTMHLNEDIVCVQKEYIDREQRKFVPIVTDFSRLAQPIVRYRLNDLLTERGQPCPCGSPLLAVESIDGRCDDLFYFPEVQGSGRVPVFPDNLSRAVLTASGAVEQYRLVQHAPDRLEIALQAPETERETARRAVAAELEWLFRRKGCRAPAFDFTEYVPPSVGRKLRRVERRFDFER